MRRNFNKLKSFLAFSLVLLMAVALLANPMEADAAKKKSGSNTFAVGDDIAMGRLDGVPLSWTILSYDDTTKIAFVVSRKSLSSYSVSSYRKAIENALISSGAKAGYVRWSDNYWRGWCNEIFYTNSFTDEERAKIQKTTLTAEAAKTSLMNFYHDTSLDAYYVENGKKNSLYMDIYESQTTSSDYIFFLSTDEFTAYKDSMKFEAGGIWPLRTNAYDDPNQGLFANDTTKLIERKYYYSGDSIRPAMYVQLAEVEETADTSSSNSTSTENSNTTSTTAATTTTTATTAASTAATATTQTSTATAKTTVKAKSYANNGTNIGSIQLPEDSSHTLSVGSTAQVAIDMEYLNSTDKEYTVTYKSSDASVFTVDSNGLVTAAGSGIATLSVKMKKSNGKIYSMSCRIDVN